MSAAQPRPSSWEASWPTDTMELAYQEARQAALDAEKWADALDAKVATVFSVAAGIVTLVPAFQGSWSPIQAVLWAIAAVCFLVVAHHCRRAYAPRRFRFGPNPSTLQTPEWLALPRSRYCYRMLEWLGKTFERNREIVEAKAEALSSAMLWIALEVVALSLALILPRLDVLGALVKHLEWVR